MTDHEPTCPIHYGNPLSSAGNYPCTCPPKPKDDGFCVNDEALELCERLSIHIAYTEIKDFAMRCYKMGIIAGRKGYRP